MSIKSVMPTATASDLGNCQYARSRHHGILIVRDRWNNLLYVFGILVVGLTIVASVLVLNKAISTALTTLAGDISSGAGVLFVRGERNHYEKQEKEAYKDVEKACGNALSAKNLRAKARRVQLVYYGISTLVVGSAMFLVVSSGSIIIASIVSLLVFLLVPAIILQRSLRPP